MFSDALMFTQQRTGFAAHLIEKAYFCTLVLEYLASACPELVFKGGRLNPNCGPSCEPRISPNSTSIGPLAW
jgi:hypothetical protein